MPNPPPPIQPKHKATTGRLNACPCPWCEHPNDFRPLAGDEDGSSGWGSQGLERGARMSCDNCGLFFKILQIEKITVIKLVPSQ